MTVDLPTIESAEDVFSLAAAMEREAARRYAELAAEVRAMGHEDVARAFDELAEKERSHEDMIEAWARREIGTSAKTDTHSWDMGGEVLALDEDELTDPYTLTPYRALSIAVHNEERAFAFFSYLSAHLSDPQLRAYVDGLAREELDHAARLRPLRRRAYHAERGTRERGEFDIRKRTPRDMRSFRAASGPLESRVAAILTGVAEARRAAGDEEAAAMLSDLAAQSAEAARRAGASSDAGTAARPAKGLRDALLELEEAYEFYARVGDTAPSEELMDAAQEMMASTIARIARLRDLITRSMRKDGAGA